MGELIKKLVCEVVDFSGKVISIVEETETFDFALFNGRKSPLFRRSAPLHFVFLGARASAGCDEIFYQRGLKALMYFLPENNKMNIHNMGSFSSDTVKAAHLLLERAGVQGKLVMTVRS